MGSLLDYTGIDHTGSSGWCSRYERKDILACGISGPLFFYYQISKQQICSILDANYLYSLYHNFVPCRLEKEEIVENGWYDTMKTQFVSDLKPEVLVDDVFVIDKKGSVNQYKNGKAGSWFSLVLSDKTGKISAKYWGNNDAMTNSLYDSILEGDHVKIHGKTTSYDNKTEIHMEHISKSADFEIGDFIKTCSKNSLQMISNLRQIVKEVKNPYLKHLLESFVNDEKFMNEQSSQAPAGKNWHHDYVGGLLEHVLSLIDISRTVQKNHPELDFDLLVIGCILHDIGKVKEFKITNKIQITDYGRLFGHISIGFLMVSEKISSIPGFPEELKNKVLHMILSHHRQLEHGSPVVPMFPEAVAFSMIDDTDAKTQHAIQLVEQSKNEWEYEDDYSGHWFWTNKN